MFIKKEKGNDEHISLEIYISKGYDTLELDELTGTAFFIRIHRFENFRIVQASIATFRQTIK